MVKSEDLLEYMHGLRFGDRLDQFDYERLGVEEKWGPRVTILLLASFEMETKGYYDRDDAAKAYNTIYSKYQSLVYKPLHDRAFPFFPGPDVPEEHTFDVDKARFKQEDFLRYLEMHNKTRLDIPRLLRFLNGEEFPGMRVKIIPIHPAVEAGSSTTAVSDHIKSKAQDGTDERWDLNRVLKEKAREYALECLKKGCTCNHAQLGKFIYENAVDDEGVYLLEGADEAMVSENVIKNTVKLFFIKHGNNRIKGKTGVLDTKDCSVHHAVST